MLLLQHRLFWVFPGTLLTRIENILNKQSQTVKKLSDRIRTRRGLAITRKYCQCMCNVTLTHVRVTIVVVGNNTYYIFWVCVCSLRYPACNAHASYFHLWSTLLHNIFSTLSHKRHDLSTNVTEHKMRVLIFCTTFVWNISHSKKNWARYDQKCISVCM